MNQQQRRGIGCELFNEELALVTGGAGQASTSVPTARTRQHGQQATQSLSAFLGADTVAELPPHLQPLFVDGPNGIQLALDGGQR